MINLKNILAENMLRFGTKNLSAAQRNLINEAGTEYLNTRGGFAPPKPNPAQSYEFGDLIPLYSERVNVTGEGAYKIAFTSFTPTTAGKLMGFDTKSYISQDKTYPGWKITGTGRNAVLAKHAGTSGVISLAFESERDLMASINDQIGPGGMYYMARNSAANGWKVDSNAKGFGPDTVQAKVVPHVFYANQPLGSLKQNKAVPSGAQFLSQNYNAAAFAKMFPKVKVPATDFDYNGVIVGKATFTTNNTAQQITVKNIVLTDTSIGVGAFAKTAVVPK